MGNQRGRTRRGWRRVLVRWGRGALHLVGMMMGVSIPEPARDDDPGRQAAAPREKRLDSALVRHLAGTREIEIETRRSPAAPAYRVPIRAVVDQDGHVYARPAEGTHAYWYRRILINPGVTLHTGVGPVYVRVVPEVDGPTAAVVSELYRQKYGPDEPEIVKLLGEDARRTTVRFERF